MKTCFPNLFVIGAMKAGTSSLHEYLHVHPDIFMANAGRATKMKEISYFAPHRTPLGVPWGEGHPNPGLSWYLGLFSEAQSVQYAGETSVLYAARPRISGCELRIHRFNPHARIIYILRDPVERAISHYWWKVRGGFESRSLLPAMRSGEDYLARSHYAMQLAPYLETFGMDQVYVLTLEMLHSRPLNTLWQLFDWLGVQKDIIIDTTNRFNVGQPATRRTRKGMMFFHMMMQHWRWRQSEPRLPATVLRLLRKCTYGRVCKETIDHRPAVDFLRPILQRYTQTLAELLQREFPEWKTLYPDY